MRLRNYCERSIDEATYITHNMVNEIYSKIVEFIKGKHPNVKRARKMYNLTEIMRGLGKAFIDLRFKSYGAIEARTSRYGNPVIFMKIPESYRKKINSGEIKKVLDHELVHVIDKLRSGKYELKTSKKYKSKVGAAYFKEPTEFNAVVHEIKQLATKSKKKQFDKIKSREDFVDFLKKEKLYILKKFAELIEQNPSWYKKLITRLNREDLLPSKLDLKEEWADTVKARVRGTDIKNAIFATIDVFKNPTKKEIQEVSKNGSIRYIAFYPSKTLYVFSPEILHLGISRKFGIENFFDRDDVIGGVAAKGFGKWHTIEAHNIQLSGHAKKILKKDWSWVDKYINLTDFFKIHYSRSGYFKLRA